MNTWYQKLYESKDMEEFYKVSGEIRKAIEASPAEMMEELSTAYLEAREAADAAGEAYKLTENALDEAETVENKAAAWDAYWEHRNMQACASELYEQNNEAAYYVEFPEEVKRSKAEHEAFTAALESAAVSDDPF